MNVIDLEVIDELSRIVETVACRRRDQGLRRRLGQGGVLGRRRPHHAPGPRRAVREAQAREGRGGRDARLLRGIAQAVALYRRLETCGKPFAAAIHGVCLGGAFELALACHHRVASDVDATRVGLPEIKVGLFPGAGGTQRVARLMQTGDALQMLFKGEQIRPLMAKNMGLVHEVAPRDQIVEKAKAWIRGGGLGVAPWDQPKFKAPSGKVYSPAGMMIWPPANAIYRRETHDNYPAAKAILQAVYEGLQLPMDLALKVESRYFAKILRSTEAAAMIRTLFISMGELNKGARRPAGVPATSDQTRSACSAPASWGRASPT